MRRVIVVDIISKCCLKDWWIIESLIKYKKVQLDYLRLLTLPVNTEQSSLSFFNDIFHMIANTTLYYRNLCDQTAQNLS